MPKYRNRFRCQTAIAALLLLAVSGCATGSAEQRRRSAQGAYKLGLAYLAEGRPSPALQEFAKAEALTPDDPEVLNAAGLAYWARREHAVAEQKFQKATALKPDYSEAWNNLGALYLDLGRYDAAIAPLENALKSVFYDTRERALANLGWAYYKLGRAGDAEARLREALEAAPDFPFAQKSLAIVLQERGEHREAVKLLTSALEAMPDDADAHLRKGLSQFRLGEREASRVEFEAAWRLAPGGEVGRSAKNYLDMLQ